VRQRRALTPSGHGADHEQARDYDAAIGFYREALAREPVQTPTWYFIQNNLGYCLVTQGKPAEAEIYCRKAIEIDPAARRRTRIWAWLSRVRGVFAKRILTTSAASMCQTEPDRRGVTQRRFFTTAVAVPVPSESARERSWQTSSTLRSPVFPGFFGWCVNAAEAR